MSNELHEAAIAYARRGWPVFPLHGIVDGKCSCGAAGCTSPGKHPREIKGFHNATTDELTINRWWVRWPDANIGIPCGPQTFTVVDIDPAHGGEDSYLDLRSENGNHPETLMQISGSGGTHLCFKYHPDVGNTQSKVGKGIDTRGQGKGYIAVAPSRHISGGYYRWSDESIAPVDIPEWLIPGRNVVPPPPPPPVLAQGEEPLPWDMPESDAIHIERRAREYLRRCDPAIQGQGGHAKLLWAARALVWGYELDEATAYRLLADEYNPKCVPPWDLGKPKDNQEFRRKIREGRTPCDKPKGWLLAEDMARDAAELEQGRLMAAALIAEAFPPAPVVAAIVAPLPAAPDQHNELLNPPGMLGELCHWINSRAFKQQPLLTLGNSLAFCGALFGRKVCDEWDLRTNIYCIGIGESCCGKDSSRKYVKALCDAAGVTDKLLAGEDATADSAIEAVLSTRPSCLLLWDEIGHMISNMKDKNSSGHRKTIMPILMKLYSSANSSYLGKEYTDGEQRRDLNQPNCCLYGTTVPDVLWKGFTSSEVTDGLLGRMLVFISDDPDPEPNRDGAKKRPIPQRLIDWVQAWVKYVPPAPADTGDLEAVKGVWQQTIIADETAEAVFSKMEAKIKKRRAAMLEQRNPVRALWGRVAEIARKVALITAVSDSPNPGASVITATHAGFACSLVERLTERFISEVQEHIADNDLQRLKQRIIKMIKDSRTNGMTKNEITRRTQDISSRTRDEILQELLETTQVWIKEIPTTKAGGRSGKRYYANTMKDE